MNKLQDKLPDEFTKDLDPEMKAFLEWSAPASVIADEWVANRRNIAQWENIQTTPEMKSFLEWKSPANVIADQWLPQRRQQAEQEIKSKYWPEAIAWQVKNTLSTPVIPQNPQNKVDPWFWLVNNIKQAVRDTSGWTIETDPLLSDKNQTNKYIPMDEFKNTWYNLQESAWLTPWQKIDTTIPEHKTLSDIMAWMIHDYHQQWVSIEWVNDTFYNRNRWWIQWSPVDYEKQLSIDSTDNKKVTPQDLNRIVRSYNINPNQDPETTFLDAIVELSNKWYKIEWVNDTEDNFKNYRWFWVKYNPDVLERINQWAKWIIWNITNALEYSIAKTKSEQWQWTLEDNLKEAAAQWYINAWSLEAQTNVWKIADMPWNFLAYATWNENFKTHLIWKTADDVLNIAKTWINQQTIEDSKFGSALLYTLLVPWSGWISAWAQWAVMWLAEKWNVTPLDVIAWLAWYWIIKWWIWAVKWVWWLIPWVEQVMNVIDKIKWNYLYLDDLSKFVPDKDLQKVIDFFQEQWVDRVTKSQFMKALPEVMKSIEAKLSWNVTWDVIWNKVWDTVETLAETNAKKTSISNIDKIWDIIENKSPASIIDTIIPVSKKQFIWGKTSDIQWVVKDIINENIWKIKNYADLDNLVTWKLSKVWWEISNMVEKIPWLDKTQSKVFTNALNKIIEKFSADDALSTAFKDRISNLTKLAWKKQLKFNEAVDIPRALSDIEQMFNKQWMPKESFAQKDIVSAYNEMKDVLNSHATKEWFKLFPELNKTYSNLKLWQDYISWFVNEAKNETAKNITNSLWSVWKKVSWAMQIFQNVKSIIFWNKNAMTKAEIDLKMPQILKNFEKEPELYIVIKKNIFDKIWDAWITLDNFNKLVNQVVKNKLVWWIQWVWSTIWDLKDKVVEKWTELKDEWKKLLDNKK